MALPFKGRRLLLIGNPEEFSVGHHFAEAAREMKIEIRCLDSREAYRGLWLRRKWDWVVRGKRPSSLRAFSESVVDECRAFRPDWVLTTGIAPVDAPALKQLAELSTCLNYLTDDPWNPFHHAEWFFSGLPIYHFVHTTRTANVEELKALGCRSVHYTPFAYDPVVHAPADSLSRDERDRLECDLFFAGSGDADRAVIMGGLIREGFSLALYGEFWDRFVETRGHSRGFLFPAEARKAILASKVHLGLVRRANRDGHSMRSFEVAAMGGCLLLEDTAEHREIFGAEGKCALYFASDAELSSKARTLLGDADLRKRLSRQARRAMISGGHAYRDRLEEMLARCMAVRSLARARRA